MAQREVIDAGVGNLDGTPERTTSINGTYQNAVVVFFKEKQPLNGTSLRLQPNVSTSLLHLAFVVPDLHNKVLSQC